MLDEGRWVGQLAMSGTMTHSLRNVSENKITAITHIIHIHTTENIFTF